MSAADRLREAARVLRERAEAATPGPWSGFQADDALGNDWFGVTTDMSPTEEGKEGDVFADPDAIAPDAAYIATMHPGVGLALADWLDDEADERRWGRLRDFDAVGISDRIADLILGGAA